MVKLVTDWLLNQIGGLDKMLAINRQKAASCSTTRSTARGGFYQAHAEPASRSMMNVPFRLADAALGRAFLKQAAGRGLRELRGTARWAAAGPRSTTPCPSRASTPCATSCSNSAKKHGGK